MQADRKEYNAGDDAGEVAIVGGGLAGAMLALALAQAGHRVNIYEKRPDPRLVQENGRSINLGLSKRGMQALSMVGLLDDVLAKAVTMYGRVIHAPDGSSRFQPYGRNSTEVLHSIDRNMLNRLLLDHAEKIPSVRLFFEHKLQSIDREQKVLTFESNDGVVTVKPAWMVGADGAFSAARKELQHGMRADYRQEYLEWGYKELTLHPRSDGESLIELTALHVWPRNHCLFVSHPNQDASHTLTLFLPHEGPDSFASVQSDRDVMALMEKYFPDILPLVPDLMQQWRTHPVGSLITTRTAPWCFGDWAVLVGDACHAVYPFYGQGMNSAFEDCCTLIEALALHRGNRADAFLHYENNRRVHTDALAELSKENFVELRSRVKSPWFLARKKLDLWLGDWLPSYWKPLYSMIAHSIIPYQEARERARRQDRWMRNVVMSCVGCVGILSVMALMR